ncbi:globin domain-containing protein [Corynebacterium freiburgense]|uniref:globin domain-containing protein n=1 Tax=Corynebacterium freiburgense TaxID=556548 RepID=UPI0004245EE8|nr:globin domain-containing protein [Corynebacterium freiburgense]WJZ03681.1 Flavohemoprotein [Corynebacterium freiburgense]
MYVTHQPNTKLRTLSDEHAEVVRATLPAIGAHINEITPLFYQKMFAAHPELISDTFNRGNQKQGDQQKALAASIAVFASMLVDPEAPDPVEMLSRIGHKHVSLGIVEDQYPIVHKHLFEAIVEVLGDAVTPEVAAAWDAVYWIMADVLIQYEKDLYESDNVAHGDVFRKATVAAREDLNNRVTLYTLRGEDLIAGLPGQYTSIGVTLDDGARQLRQYSLVKADQGEWQIAVARDGEVSSFLRDRVNIGDEIEATLPAGELVLADGDAPVVLISQGIGSTPMVGMLSAINPSRKVVVLHADESETDHAQRAQTEALLEKLPNAQYETFYRSNGQRLEVAGKIPEGAEVYLCGGTSFLQNVRDQLQAEKPVRIHYELFSPNDWLIG